MKIQPRAVEGFLQQPDPSLRVILVYGPDSGLVRERVNHLASRIAPNLDDPFQVSLLSDEDLKQVPSRLSDEAAQISFGPDRRLILVRAAQQATAKALKIFLKELPKDLSKEEGPEDVSGHSLILLQAGDLSPRDDLRAQCEAHKYAAAVPCYLGSPQVIQGLMREIFGRTRVAIDREAENFVLSQLGADHGISRQEIEKLALYAGEGGSLGLNEVLHMLGNTSDARVDETLGRILCGDWRQAEPHLEELLRQGVSPIAILRPLASALLRLKRLHILMQSGQGEEAAIKSCKPPIFFKQIPLIKRQLNLWDLKRLDKLLQATLDVEAACKRTQAPAALLMTYLCLQIAQRAGYRG